MDGWRVMTLCCFVGRSSKYPLALVSAQQPDRAQPTAQQPGHKLAISHACVSTPRRCCAARFLYRSFLVSFNVNFGLTHIVYCAPASAASSGVSGCDTQDLG